MAREFEVDVSGQDLFNRDYTIVISERSTSNIKGFKFTEDILKAIKDTYLNGISKRAKTMLKIRLYCIVVYYLFKSLKINEQSQVNLTICRDFHGHERDISSQLKYFLEDLLKLKINLYYSRLEDDSADDRYAYLFSKDKQNLFAGKVHIPFEDLGKFIKPAKKKN